jgi:hypothetical protein
MEWTTQPTKENKRILHAGFAEGAVAELNT